MMIQMMTLMPSRINDTYKIHCSFILHVALYTVPRQSCHRQTEAFPQRCGAVFRWPSVSVFYISVHNIMALQMKVIAYSLPILIGISEFASIS